MNLVFLLLPCDAFKISGEIFCKISSSSSSTSLNFLLMVLVGVADILIVDGTEVRVDS